MAGSAVPSDVTAVASQIAAALDAGDPDAVGALLAPDVRWGDDGTPNACRSRQDVVALLAEGRAAGGTATVAEVVPGPAAVLCGLDVHWPAARRGPRDGRLYHVYRVRDGLVHEVLAFGGDRRSAAEAAGVA